MGRAFSGLQRKTGTDEWLQTFCLINPYKTALCKSRKRVAVHPHRLVLGYFAVATEIFNDSGVPHCLEHLVFMGSEKWPYKGIIDNLANRSFSDGTNAWTDISHTAYTVSTAGSQGFLQILPAFVDHILYPTLSAASFITEVYHIDPTGRDSGVVFSEMEGRENTSGDLMALAQQRLLEPPGNAYRSETGGLMSAIRVLTPDQIREYHATYYVPHNLCLIVAGKLSAGTSSLLSVIQDKVETNLIAHDQNRGPRPPGWKRPFLETASAYRPPIPVTPPSVVEFPEKDETVGELLITTLGPAPNNFLERQALDILATYLTSGTAAPLNKEFVEISSPLCTYIYFSEDMRAMRVYLPIYISSVPTEILDEFPDKLKKCLEGIVRQGIDMNRMSMIINRDERQLRSKLESAKGDTYSTDVINDFLYGSEDGVDLPLSMDDMKEYAALREWSSDQWAGLLNQYYVDTNSVVVVGKPSSKLVDTLEKEYAERLDERVKRLGPEGLAQAERELEAAKLFNDRPIPEDLLTSFRIPSVESISWIPVASFQDPGVGRKQDILQSDTPLSRLIQQDGPPLPFFVQYDHVESDFVSLHAFFSLEKLPHRLRPYISTYLATFFTSSVARQSGEILSHEEVVNKLDSETVSYEVGLGINDLFAECLRLSIKVETALYEKAVGWLRDLVYGAVFTKERLQVTIAKLQQSLPELKRDGNTVLNSAWADLVYSERSTSRAVGILPQVDFMPKLSQELKENPADVLTNFEEIRKHVTDPSGIRFSVTGNVMKLKSPRGAWSKHFKSSVPESPLAPVPLARDTLNEIGNNPVRKAVVISLPTTDSSYVTHTTKCIQGFAHAEYPALRVALEVLNATESYLWRYIRGSGLAYGAFVSLDLESGHLSFSLHRSSNSMKALQEAANVVKGLVDGSVVLDDITLEGAKSSIVYAVTKSVSTAGRAALGSFTNQALKGVTQNHQVELLKKFEVVSKEDVLSVLRTYFLPLFESSSSVAAVITAPGKADQIVEEMGKLGFTVEKKQLDFDPSEMDDSGSDSGTDKSSD